MVKWKHRTVKNLNTLRRTHCSLYQPPAAALLSDLKDRRFHMAVVVDSGAEPLEFVRWKIYLKSFLVPSPTHQQRP